MFRKLIAAWAIFAATTSLIRTVSLASPDSPPSPGVDANGSLLPDSTDETITVGSVTREHTEADKSSLVDTIGKYFLVRKSFLTSDDASEPAKFSWTKSKGESSFYELDFALGLNPKGFPFLHNGYSTPGWDVNWKIQPTFEAHTSTKVKAEQDSLSGRLPVSLYFQPNRDDAFISQHKVMISMVYETDRYQETATFGGDFYYTPTIPALAAGVEQSSGDLTFRWRPFIGVEGGHILENDNGALDPSKSEFFRFVFKLHADLWIGKQFALAGDYSMRSELIGRRETHPYVEASPTLFLDKDHHFSVGLSYKRGKTTPDFSEVNSFNAWVGLLF